MVRFNISCARWSYLLSLWIKSQSVTNQMKATEQYLRVAMFIVLYQLILTFKSTNKIHKRDSSNESIEL